MGYNDRNERSSRNDAPREMHSVVCSDCGNNCQVPFKPNGTKPLRCSDCFKKSDPGGRTGERSSRPSFGDRPKPAPRVDYSKQLESISAKMDKIIRLLETGSLSTPDGTEASREREERKEEKQTVDHDALKETISTITQ